MFIHELNINEMEKPKNEEKEKCNSLFQIWQIVWNINNVIMSL